ncbi:MAG: hypothetical protein WDZ83_12620 [Rhizobiaceae bacterium]
MAGVFRVGEEKPQARYEYRARILTKTEAEKHTKSGSSKKMIENQKLQSFQLGLSSPGHRRAPLTVLAPRRVSLLAGAQNPGAQTIPFRQGAL